MASLIWLIPVAVLIFYVVMRIFSKKIPNNTALGFTGALGSGKTYIGVHQAIKHYKKIKLIMFLNRLLPSKLRFMDVKNKPVLYSNIPIYLGKRFIFFGPGLWSSVLTYDHLTGITKIPEYSTIFVDEFGQFASQYDYDNPFVMQYLQKFLRLFRHWTDGKLIFTDQSSSNIVKALRTRLNQIYHLSDFRRFGLFFYKVNVQELQYLEEGVQTITTQEEIQELPYFFGYLPFKYLKFLNPFKKRYDSRCYSITYKPIRDLVPDNWAKYKTDYFIELPNNTAMRSQYRKNGFIPYDDMKNYLDDWEKAKTSNN